MRKIPLFQRKETFKEVSEGFNEEEAVKEAQRCLQCSPPPCQEACPLKIDIKEFIKFIAAREFKKAEEKIREQNTLPSICGRVCPQENLCQKKCTLAKKGKPISIGYLERFVSDREENSKSLKTISPRKRKNKVAVVGSGPAGLTCASELLKKGFRVVILEALQKEGGVLRYGIPEFRLPKKVLDKEVEYIKRLGGEIVTNFVVGKTKSIEDLKKEGFNVFFLGIGAGFPKFLGIKGENAKDVYSANEFLTRINLMKGYLFPKYHTPLRIGKRIGIIGGGNVAFDCARCAIRLKAEEVFIIYRREKEEMPARKEEIKNACEEGVKFYFLSTPKEIISDEEGNVKGIICLKNQPGERDSSGRRKPIPIKNSEFLIPLETVIVAIGTEANPLLLNTMPDLKLNEKGYIVVNKDFQTSIPYIFAGGDIVSGTATVVEAIKQGKAAAKSIERLYG